MHAQHLTWVVTAAGEQALLVLLAQIPREIRFCNPASARFETRDRIFVQGAERAPRPSADAPHSTPGHELVQPPAVRTVAETDLRHQPRASVEIAIRDGQNRNRFTQNLLEFHCSDGYGNLMPYRRQRYSVRIRRVQSRWAPTVTADRAGSPVSVYALHGHTTQ
jgi:hypothetical protein